MTMTSRGLPLTNSNRSAVQAEKALLKTLTGKEPTFAEIAQCLTESVPSGSFTAPLTNPHESDYHAGFAWLASAQYSLTSMPPRQKMPKSVYGMPMSK